MPSTGSALSTAAVTTTSRDRSTTRSCWRGSGDLLIDRAARRVTIRGTPVILAAKEYELLVKLAEEPVRVFTKEQLLREVWGFRSLGRTRTLDSHASRLRRKLAAAGGDFVRNVWGVGYSLVEE
jgi:DNA-binding response OmpR family regulator